MTPIQKQRTYGNYRRLNNKAKELYVHICYYCGITLNKNNISVDHLTPLSRGGRYKLSNMRLCCKDCNFEKGNMTEQEYKDFKGIETTYLFLQNKKCIENNNPQYKALTYDDILDLHDIIVPQLYLQRPVRKKKIEKVLNYYSLYNSFDKPVTLKRRTIIDGYSRYVAAKILKLDSIPVVYK